jgi:hypothetical protein
MLTYAGLDESLDMATSIGSLNATSSSSMEDPLMKLAFPLMQVQVLYYH